MITPVDTTSQIRAMVAPFVGARMNRERCPDGYMKPRTEFIDIRAPGILFYDADVREIGDDCLVVCRHGGFDEVIAFADLIDMRVRREGAADMVYVPMWRAAA